MEHVQACRVLLVSSAEISRAQLKEMENTKGDFAAGSAVENGGLSSAKRQDTKLQIAKYQLPPTGQQRSLARQHELLQDLCRILGWSFDWLVAPTPVCDLYSAKIDSNQEDDKASNVGGKKPLEQPGGEKGHDDCCKCANHDCSQISPISIIPTSTMLQRHNLMMMDCDCVIGASLLIFSANVMEKQLCSQRIPLCDHWHVKQTIIQAEPRSKRFPPQTVQGQGAYAQELSNCFGANSSLCSCHSCNKVCWPYCIALWWNDIKDIEPDLSVGRCLVLLIPQAFTIQYSLSVQWEKNIAHLQLRSSLSHIHSRRAILFAPHGELYQSQLPSGIPGSGLQQKGMIQDLEAPFRKWIWAELCHCFHAAVVLLNNEKECEIRFGRSSHWVMALSGLLTARIKGPKTIPAILMSSLKVSCTAPDIISAAILS